MSQNMAGELEGLRCLATCSCFASSDTGASILCICSTNGRGLQSLGPHVRPIFSLCCGMCEMEMGLLLTSCSALPPLDTCRRARRSGALTRCLPFAALRRDLEKSGKP